MPGRTKSTQKLRMEIAEIAARLIANEEATDYHSAKKKAALQLGFSADRKLPTNLEVEKALTNYQNLFQSENRDSRLKTLRQQAAKAMSLLSKFRPLLVGPIVSGTATSSSEITLHLFADPVEQVGLYLSEQGIPSTACEKHVRVDENKTLIYPAYRFIADQTSFLLVVFSEKDKNLSPLSSINNKAMKMMKLEDVLKLLETNDDPLSIR